MALRRPVALASLWLVLACGKGSPREPSGNEPGGNDTGGNDTGGSDTGGSVTRGAAAEGGATLGVSLPASVPSPGARDLPAAAGAPEGEAPLEASDACAALPRQTCMESTACTLVHDPQPPRRDLYRCRPAEPPCETIVPQSAFSGESRDAARRQCEARTECAFRDADCYCPCRGSGQTLVPDGPEARACNCVCGGGAPAQCTLRR